MSWHLNALALLSRQNVVSTVALIVNILGSHEGSNSAIFVILLQSLAILSVVVAQIQQVVGSTTLIFLACIEMILFDLQGSCFFLLLIFHVFKSVDFSLVALLAQVSPPVLNVLILLLANSLVGNSKVFVETLLLYQIIQVSD